MVFTLSVICVLTFVAGVAVRERVPRHAAALPSDGASGGAVGHDRQVVITASQSGQTTDAYCAGYQGVSGCSDGFWQAVSIAKVSLPHRVRGPVAVGVPGAVGAACTRRTVRAPPGAPPGQVRGPTGLSSSYTTTIAPMPPR
ncbi:hypothetical protein MBT84_48750 [Streptomyces sp. MBT84]|nr:hypothetical protein [Streptomyces sp. MBT84]